MINMRRKKRSRTSGNQKKGSVLSKPLSEAHATGASGRAVGGGRLDIRNADSSYKDGTYKHSNDHELGVRRQYEFYGSVREKIVSEIWLGITVLCAEPGMGKTWTLIEAMRVWKEKGYTTRHEDFYGLNPSEVTSKLVTLEKWAQRARQTQHRRLLILDNISVGNEYELSEEARIIEGMASNLCSVLIGMSPECEVLANELAGVTVYRSCDLRYPRPLGESDSSMYDIYTHGIPQLYNALSRLNVSSSDAVLSDPSYLDPFVDLLEKSLRPQLMGEERRMRICMALFGEGTFDDLRAVLTTVDESVWRDIARDAPFFGIDVVHGSFSCVGSLILDALKAACKTLEKITSDCPELVMRVARRLMGKNLVLRSAYVSSICSDAEMRTSLGLEWSAQYIDAGALDIVKNALEDARSQGRVYLKGFYETECMVELLEGDKSLDLVGMLRNLRGHSLQTEKTRLAIVCRGIWRGVFLTDVCEKNEDLAFDLDSFQLEADDSASDCLALHARVLSLLVRGCLVQAYTLLLDVAGFLSSESGSHVLLSMDYMFCSLALGIAPSPTSVATFEESRDALKTQGFTRLSKLCELVLPVGRMLGGRIGDGNEYDAVIHNAERAGDELLRAMLLLASGVADMKNGAHLRAHVRIERAANLFSSMGLEVLEKEARLLVIASRAALNEKVKNSELRACKRSSRSLDYVVAVMLRAQANSEYAGQAGASYWGDGPCPGDVLWLVNVLANNCKFFSSRFKEAMPVSWLKSLERSVEEVETFFGRSNKSVEDTMSHFEQRLTDTDFPAFDDGEPKIYVSLFGGLELHVNDNLIPSEHLGRRSAGYLLALLAAVPEHRLPRFVVIESLWPDSGFEAGMKALYAATSVLRSEVSDFLDVSEEVNFVFSNRSEGTIGLNESIVTCDVDVFEEKVLEVVLNEKRDYVVTELCQSIEQIYKGDLYVAPMDCSGVASKRKQKTKEEFVNSMVQGAKSALNLGDKMLACHFAQKASDVNEMREDVVAVRARALYVTDREQDAFKCYEDFAATLVNKKLRPSQSMRKAMADTLGEAYWKESNRGLRVPDRENLKMKLIETEESKAPNEMSLGPNE